jgi:putative thioredoxin
VVNVSSSGFVFDVEEADFERQVLQSSRERPVVVDFWAPWCGPCRHLGPMLEKLVEDRHGDVLLAKVDIDRAQRLAMEYRIDAIPAVIAFRDGKPVLDFVGVLPEEQLRAFLDQLIPSEVDRLVQQAGPLEEKRPAEAEALYRQALKAEDQNQGALVGLARVLLGKGNENEAAELLACANTGGEHAAEVERLTAILALRQLVHGFGDEATLRRRLDKESANPVLRYELGCVLAAAGRYREALDLLLSAAESDRKLGASEVREAMVKIFQVIGSRSEMADQYRDRLTRVLY